MSRPNPVKQTRSRLEAGATPKRPRAIGATRSRGYLPHWEGEHPIYFVTFRLADSLPRSLVLQLRRHRESTKKVTPAAEAGAGRARAHDLDGVLETAERCLDSGLGECHMRDSRIAKVVADAIQHFQGTRYNLLGWCVMPNHVHVVFAPLGENKLDAILHSWKSFSALMANRLLQRRGIFWQREYFDHLVRNERSLLKILHYVRENPTRAGLPNWPWARIIS
jgi:REP element-mobilizing transposase RayT